jgi:hypothetical protein
MEGTNDRCVTVRDARVSTGNLDGRDIGAPVAGGLRTKASASDNSVLIEFAKGAVFSEDTALAVRYGAERTGLGGALCIVDVAALHHTAQACADSVKPETGAASSCSTRPELVNVAEITYATSAIAERANALGPKVLNELETLVTADALLRWYRELIASKWNYRINVATSISLAINSATPLLN